MKSHFALGIAALVLALISGALGQSRNALPGAPKLVLAETGFNLGAVKAGDAATHSFVFRNEGTADLVIGSVAPS